MTIFWVPTTVQVPLLTTACAVTLALSLASISVSDVGTKPCRQVPALVTVPVPPETTIVLKLARLPPTLLVTEGAVTAPPKVNTPKLLIDVLEASVVFAMVARAPPAATCTVETASLLCSSKVPPSSTFTVPAAPNKRPVVVP